MIFYLNFRNDLIGQQTTNNANINSILQQLQQLQLQQQQNPANLTLIQDIRSQQEALITQFLATNNSNKQQASSLISPASMPDIDPAILGASNVNGGREAGVSSSSSSIWGDMNNASNRISPPNNNVLITSPPIPLSISPINNLIQQQQQQQQHQSVNKNMSSFAQVAANLDNSMLNPNTASLVQQIQALNTMNNSNGQNNLINLNTLQMLNDNNIKDKIQMLFEQTKKEEERRRKQEEYQLKVRLASSFLY